MWNCWVPNTRLVWFLWINCLSSYKWMDCERLWLFWCASFLSSRLWFMPCSAHITSSCGTLLRSQTAAHRRYLHIWQNTFFRYITIWWMESITSKRACLCLLTYGYTVRLCFLLAIIDMTIWSIFWMPYEITLRLRFLQYSFWLHLQDCLMEHLLFLGWHDDLEKANESFLPHVSALPNKHQHSS